MNTGYRENKIPVLNKKEACQCKTQTRKLKGSKQKTIF